MIVECGQQRQKNVFLADYWVYTETQLVCRFPTMLVQFVGRAELDCVDICYQIVLVTSCYGCTSKVCTCTSTVSTGIVSY